jgi:hypothetical protein
MIGVGGAGGIGEAAGRMVDRDGRLLRELGRVFTDRGVRWRIAMRSLERREVVRRREIRGERMRDMKRMIIYRISFYNIDIDIWYNQFCHC